MDTLRADRLLLPTAIDLYEAVDPPDDGAHAVDRYERYTVREEEVCTPSTVVVP